MPLIALRQLPDHAAEHGYGVPAINVNNMEPIHAIAGHGAAPGRMRSRSAVPSTEVAQ